MRAWQIRLLANVLEFACEPQRSVWTRELLSLLFPLAHRSRLVRTLPSLDLCCSHLHNASALGQRSDWGGRWRIFSPASWPAWCSCCRPRPTRSPCPWVRRVPRSFRLALQQHHVTLHAADLGGATGMDLLEEILSSGDKRRIGRLAAREGALAALVRALHMRGLGAKAAPLLAALAADAALLAALRALLGAADFAALAALALQEARANDAAATAAALLGLLLAGADVAVLRSLALGRCLGACMAALPQQTPALAALASSDTGEVGFDVSVMFADVGCSGVGVSARAARAGEPADECCCRGCHRGDAAAAARRVCCGCSAA